MNECNMCLGPTNRSICPSCIEDSTPSEREFARNFQLHMLSLPPGRKSLRSDGSVGRLVGGSKVDLSRSAVNP